MHVKVLSGKRPPPAPGKQAKEFPGPARSSPFVTWGGHVSTPGRYVPSWQRSRWIGTTQAWTSTMNLERGDFALVYFPHSDLRTVKLRPVFVIQVDNLD